MSSTKVIHDAKKTSNPIMAAKSKYNDRLRDRKKLYILVIII